MEERNRFRPFTGDTNTRIRLPNAPLALMLCQIQWPSLQNLQGDISELAATFGRELEGFPLYSKSPSMDLEITPTGVTQKPGITVYQWESLDRSAMVSLTGNFVSLSQRRYEDFGSFSKQLQSVLETLKNHVSVPLTSRVGVRYVNRIVAPELLDQLNLLVNPATLGYALPELDGDVKVLETMNQVLFQVHDFYLQARSGLVPPGQTVDPAIPVVPTPSWVLDIDAFSDQEVPFSVETTLKIVSTLGDTAYDFFKFAITKEFAQNFGDES